jgi:hypothetical protein
MKLNKIVYSMMATGVIATQIFAGGDIAPVMLIEPINVVPQKTTVFYIGAGLVATGLSRDCTCDGTRLKDMTYGGIIKVGANITENIAIEARYIKSTIESDFSEVEHYGLYLKPQFMLDDNVKLYGLLGYGQTNIDYSSGTISSTLDESGLSYGGGLEYTLDNNMGFWIDMQHIFSNEGLYNTDLNLGTAGLLYNF